MTCRHCGQPVAKFPSGWWHVAPQDMYRACRDAEGNLIGKTLAEPDEDDQ